MLLSDKAVISNQVLSKSINIRSFLLLLPLFFTFDLTYYCALYIFAVVILFFFDRVNFGLANLSIPSLQIWLLLIMWGIYQAITSFSVYEGFYYNFVLILVPFSLFILFNNLDIDFAFLDKFFNLLFASGVVIAFYSFYLLSEKGFDLTYRIPSFWRHYNLLSGYLMILLMFNFSFLVNSKFVNRSWIYVASLLIILFGLLMTQTRGVWLSTIAAISFYVLRRPKLLVPVGAVVLSIVILFYEAVLDRVQSVIYFGYDVSSLGRLQAWLASLILIKDNPLFGYGFDAFKYLRDSVFGAYFVVVSHPHNTYLILILEMGLIGFLLYFSFFVRAFYYSIKMRKKDNPKELNKYLDGIQLSFVGFLIAFMFEPYFTILGPVTFMLWILIILSFYFRYKKKVV
jgi:O-antigen ligase